MLMQTFRTIHRTTLVLAIALLTSVSVFAQTQTEITTEAQLKDIAKNLNDNYVLTQDIELSDAEWTPIGTKDNPFKGTLDGQGHTIKGLTVGNGANDDKAFFGFTKNATVKNIAFTNAVVKGHKQAAIVVAQATSSTLSNIYVSGVVTGCDHVGTIAGDARDNTTITNCVSTAAALSTEHQGGGIAGWTNNSTFSYNIAYGAVTAPNNGAGGITGMVDDNGKTEYQSNLSAAPYIKGGNDRTHGINGWCNGNCSNTGSNNLSWANTVYYVGGNEKNANDITEPSNGSGIHGTVKSTDDLKKVATYTDIDFSTDTWKLEDGKWPRLKQFKTMYDAFTSISALPNIIKPGQTVTVTATTALNRSISSITSSNNDIISVDGNTLNAKKSGTCDITITSTGDDDLAQGVSRKFTITVEAVNHTISTPEELDKLRYDMTGDYELANDIDMTGRSFVPFGIVNNENAGKFTGTFDGKGHTIKGLKYDVEGKGEVGLFSQTDNATIKNLIIEGAYFKGNANVGGIVGQMYRTTITDCAVLNSYIEGRDHVGAIAGEIAQTKMGDNSYEGGTITNCFSDARIKTREYQAGGMLGTIHCGTVEKNLFTGTVEGREGDNANGMVSLIDKEDAPSLIQYNVVAAAHIYGKIGRVVSNNRLGNGKGKATKNFVSANTWVSTKAENATLAKYSDPNDYNGADIPVDKLRTKDFYTNTLGWDFDKHWTFLRDTEGKMYPVLKIMKDRSENGNKLPNTFWHTPTTTKLTYGSGEEKISTHSSYGQLITATLTQEKEIAIIDDNNNIKAKESGYTLVGEGKVTASFEIDPTIASHFSGTQDVITFDIVNGTEPIATAAEFVRKLKTKADGHYVLTNDIDLKEEKLSELGKNNAYTFKGSINGQGHVVSNASLTQEEDKDNIGIIAKTKDAVLRDIAFVDYCVNTSDKGKHVGLIGSAENTIFKNVYARGSVYGNDHVALLAGDGNGCTLTDCMVDGSVKANSQVGGFFGCTLEDGATFNHCLATGTLRATNRGWEGGFIGLVDRERSAISIQQCASAMKCWSYDITDSERNTHPFIGGNGAGNANALVFFNDNLVSSEAISDAPEKAWPNRNPTVEGGNVTDATTYNTSEAQGLYNDRGWFLNNTWTLGNNAAHPVLTAFDSKAAHTEVTLDDTKDNVQKITSANNVITDVSLTRTLKANSWNTFCVPFDFEVRKSALAGATVKEYDNIQGTTMNMKDATYIVHGRPYLVKPTAAIENPTFSAVAIYAEDAKSVGDNTYTLQGTYSPKTISEAEYGTIYGVIDNGNIVKGMKDTTIKGLRAYFIINGNGSGAKINFGDGETTGIENIVTPAVISNQKMYNLNGQYVGNDLKAMPKGIYIVNGKKVIK